MAEVREAEVSSRVAEAILADCLAAFPHVRLSVAGECMRPALDPGQTVLVVGRARRAPRVGDVVLVRQAEGLRLHRLVWGPPLVSVRSPWRTKADASRRWDPRVPPADVLGTVVEVEGRCGDPPGAWAALPSLLRALLAHFRDLLERRR